MNLVLYVINVGRTRLSKLDFETEFNIDTTNSELGFSVLNEEGKQHEIKEDNLIEVYDVFLAGGR